MKLCHVINIWLNFIMQVQKFGGGPSRKKFGAKNMQNLCRFYTTSEFDRECLGNERKYPKSEKHVTENDSFRVRRNTSGELCPTTQKVAHVSLESPKSTFSGDYISDSRGRWPLKFVQGLLAYTTIPQTGSEAPQNFKRDHL